MHEDPRRIARVTGANKGIGLEIARQLARTGVRVLLGARDAARGEAAARTLVGDGLDVHCVPLDVTDSARVSAAAARVEADWGQLDILVNNAGIAGARDGDGEPGNASVDAARRVLETNFLGALAVTQALLPLLRRPPAGRIVNFSSSLGSLTLSGNPASPYYAARFVGYAASKAALNMLTVHLAQALRDTRKRVNAACPGYVRTDLNGNAGHRSPAEGAETPGRLALLPNDGPFGALFDAQGVVPW